MATGLFRRKAKGTRILEKGKMRVKGLNYVKGWFTTPCNFYRKLCSLVGDRAKEISLQGKGGAIGLHDKAEKEENGEDTGEDSFHILISEWETEGWNCWRMAECSVYSCISGSLRYK